MFPLVVDICFLQPPIATSGETASASQVWSKGPVVRACWCAIRVEPWVYPCANNMPPIHVCRNLFTLMNVIFLAMYLIGQVL
jgi:hypothetical protein